MRIACGELMPDQHTSCDELVMACWNDSKRTPSPSGAEPLSGSKITSWRKQKRWVLVGGFGGGGLFQRSVRLCS